MRELEFRCWHLPSGAFSEAMTLDEIRLLENQSQAPDEKDYCWEQYTGLKDENGKKIFEGDIVVDDDEGEPLQVLWSEEDAQFTLNSITTSESFYNISSSMVEVIGNIHENPELLEGIK